MTKITKLTMSYSAPEDRLHFALQMENGATLRMWLTQRLARQLVLVLREQGRKLTSIKGKAGPVAEAEPMAGANGLAEAATDSREAAEAAAPVVVLADAPAWLIRNIVVTIGNDKLRLQFESDLDVVPATFVNRRSAAHWLERLRKHFMIAGWPLDLWSFDANTPLLVPAPGAKRH